MHHIPTQDYFGADAGGVLISPAQAAPWVDWGIADPNTSQAVMSAGIKVALYTDPNRVAPGDPMYTSDETTFAHDCNGHRITVSGSPDLLMDVHSTHLWTLWANEIQLMQSWGAVYNEIFEDSADEIQTKRLSALPCNFDQTDWTNYTNAMDQSVGQTIGYNGLGLIPGSGSTPGPSIGLNSTTSGGMSEDCYSGRTPTGFFYQPHWLATENTQIQMAEAGRMFVCQSNWYGDASLSVPQRIYQFASYLLTYDIKDQLLETNFLTPSALHVMPEAQLVALDPVIKTPADISGLQQSGGLYGRRYKECFFATVYVGPCAAVVNPNNPKSGAPEPFPWPKRFTHTLVVSGEGIYDGGTASLTGPPPPATMPGSTAVIALP